MAVLVAAALFAACSVRAIRAPYADLVHAQAPTVTDGRELVRTLEGTRDRQPLEPHALEFLADAELRLARRANGVARARSLRRALRLLVQARDLAPFDPDRTLALAEAEEAAAQLAGAPSGAARHFRAAARFYSQALRLSPSDAEVRQSYGRLLRRYRR